jgi:hypothetical protein
MTKEQVLLDISSLIQNIDQCTGDLVEARTRRDDGDELIALHEMESLIVAAHQELSFLYDYIKEGGKE